VPDLAGAISEIARVLRPGARFVGCEPGLDHLEDVANRSAPCAVIRRERSAASTSFNYLEVATALGFLASGCFRRRCTRRSAWCRSSESGHVPHRLAPRGTLTTKASCRSSTGSTPTRCSFVTRERTRRRGNRGNFRYELKVSRLAGRTGRQVRAGTVTAGRHQHRRHHLAGGIRRRSAGSSPVRVQADDPGRTAHFGHHRPGRFCRPTCRADGEVSVDIQLAIPADLKQANTRSSSIWSTSWCAGSRTSRGNEPDRQPLVVLLGSPP
jgi:hypothetical protein